MNAAARALAENNFAGIWGRYVSLSSQGLGMFLLVLAVLASALSVVYVKTVNRDLYSQSQTLLQQRDELNVQWGQLLLEQTTWAAPARVQSIAQQQLGMVVPNAKEISVVAGNNSTSGNGTATNG